MKAKLTDGFEIELKDACFDDWEFLELLDEVDSGNSGAIVRVARILLDKDGMDALKKHIRETDGKVKVTTMVSALTELMESANELKNSEPSPA